jgi:hypothetical protein
MQRVGSQLLAVEQPKAWTMADLTYDPNPPVRKPRPVASSPFWQSTAAVPGLQAPAPSPAPGMSAPQDTGFQIPTPMGWLSPDMARRMLTHMAPSREAIADTLGVPMDGVAWAARQLGAKGIPGGYGEPDPVTQAFDRVFNSGRALTGLPEQQTWKPSADVPGSSQNILRLLQQYLPPGGLL